MVFITNILDSSTIHSSRLDEIPVSKFLCDTLVEERMRVEEFLVLNVMRSASLSSNQILPVNHWLNFS